MSNPPRCACAKRTLRMRSPCSDGGHADRRVTASRNNRFTVISDGVAVATSTALAGAGSSASAA
eukprot:379571-Alexandrium_andersonii.AAC.1